MRIGLDLFSVVPGAGRGGGFARYTTGLVRALAELETRDSFYLFTNPLNSALFPNTGNMTQVVIPLPPQRALWPFRLAWLHGVLPVMARRHALDLMHFPMDTASFIAGLPYVVTTNDLIADVFYPRRYPGSVSPAKAKYLFVAKRRSARRASLVICPSHATATEVVTHYGVPAEQISVVWDGVDCKAFDKLNGAPVAGTPYVLSVVSLSPHKNVEGVVAAFAAARERHRLPHELHLIGMDGTDASPVKSAVQQAVEGGIPIKYLGYVPEAELASAYRNASLFLFLSHVEGFGLPPLEAMASGVAVVASNVSSVPEVCGDAAILVPPSDLEAAVNAIGRILEDSTLRTRLIEAGRERSREFSWARTASLTRAVYAKAVASACVGTGK